MKMASRNVRNLVLAVVVPLPSIAFYFLFCNGVAPEGKVGWMWGRICEWGQQHPLGLLNVLIFLNFDVLFWFIGQLQQSAWLVDPYWTILPVMMGHYFATHPSAHSNVYRSRLVLGLVWLWSMRLTYSYFRRENWQWGKNEDWRFAQYRKEYGCNWWWISFFITYFTQHVLLVGVCLPLYTIHNSQEPWSLLDTLAAFLCVSGITIAHIADTELYNFVCKNKILKELGAATVPVLDVGLWHYCRHPNYFGEMLWWCSISLFSCIVGQPWAIVGTVLNTACLFYVTVLVEKRMVADEPRAIFYRDYQQSTQLLIPWFKGKHRVSDAKRRKSKSS